METDLVCYLKLPEDFLYFTEITPPLSKKISYNED